MDSSPSKDRCWLLSTNSVGTAWACYEYLNIYTDGGWNTTKQGAPVYEAEEAPLGMREAIDIWFKIAFGYANLNLYEFLQQMGVKV